MIYHLINYFSYSDPDTQYDAAVTAYNGAGDSKAALESISSLSGEFQRELESIRMEITVSYNYHYVFLRN